MVKRYLLTVVVLFAGWILLSGKFDPMHLGIGAAGSAVIGWTFCSGKASRKSFPLLKFARFVPWELWQILKSNLRVARMVLTPKSPIAPQFVRVEPAQSDPRALTLLGCSITLTPGTLTVDVTADSMLVHALDDASAEEVRQGVIAERTRDVFAEPAE